MDPRPKSQDPKNVQEISFSPVMRYSAIFCLMILCVVMVGGMVLSLSQMKRDARSSLASAQTRTSQRIENSLSLLESLAALPEFYDPSVPPIDKVKKLDQMAGYFGYMMICYVDGDILVYSDGSEAVSLASRDYMQQLFATGQPQVTDSFAAGADGATLNYTVAVPLLGEDGQITGSLFCAIYFDEVIEILEQSAGMNGARATLVGSLGQAMSSTDGFAYGDPVMDRFRSTLLLGTSADRLQEQLLATVPGSFWSLRDGNLFYTVYQRVDNTGWDIMCTVDLWSVFAGILPSLCLVAGLAALLCLGLMTLVRRYTHRQMEVVNMLVRSIEELEKKIYQDQRPGGMNLHEIIRLTSDGLADSLTGVVTRSVFLNQAPAQLKKADPEKICALCFVDMDNLKYINDTCGHSGGDVALKSVGYILREYEKRYDGVVGRYGGDEFVLLLTGIDSEAELRSVLEELVLRLHSDIGSAGQRIPVQCSVGAAICQPGMTLEQIIADADEALYFVKQNGKGYYNIHEK